MFAWNTLAGAPETGDAANITATYSLDAAADVATNDTNPTEIDAVTHQGVYVFDLLQAETDGDLFTLAPVSGTADVELQPVFIYTDQVTPAVIALIDAAISTRSTLTQADILSDATPFAGGNVDVAISSRATSIQAAAILAAIGALNDLSDVDVWTYVAGAGRTLTSYPGLVGALSSLVCSTLLAESRIATTQLNLFIEAGTTRTITGSLYEADGGPVDLTGAELKWITSTDLEKTSAGGDITILAPPTGGAYTFTLSAAETQALVPQGDTADRIAHQLKVKLASGEIYAGFEGYIRIDDTMIDAW